MEQETGDAVHLGLSHSLSRSPFLACKIRKLDEPSSEIPNDPELKVRFVSQKCCADYIKASGSSECSLSNQSLCCAYWF